MGSPQSLKILAIVTFVILIGAVFIWCYQWLEKKPLKEEDLGRRAREALSICEKIENPQVQKACTGIVRKDYKACENLSSDSIWPKSECYISLARRLEDQSICKKIKAEMLEDYCIAFLTSDYEKCESQSLPDCSYYVALIKKDLSGCERISDKSQRSRCLAILKRESAHCATTHPGVKENCYLELAILANDPSICQNIEVEEEKNRCIKLVERKIEDLDCSGIGWQAGSCLSLAVLSGESSVCERFEKETSRDTCYFKVVMGTLAVYPEGVSRGWK